MASDQPTQGRTIRPNPKRQGILVALALVGLAIGYGLGFVFKPATAPPAVKSRYAPPVKGQSPPLAQLSTENKAKLAPKAPTLPIPNVVLPENALPQGEGPVRAYEEALPKEVVVTVERLGVPKAPPATALPATPVELAAVPAAAVKAPKTWHKYAIPVAPDGRPMIAIVFDDLGIDKSRTRRAIALPGPMSMSFLTYAKRATEQIGAAREAGHEIWMHVPMEPSSRSIDPGPKVLLREASPEELASSLEWSLDRFDGYVGINNHMGSRFTTYLPGMEVLMAELNRRGLAFLDSVTSGRSMGRKAAVAAGVDFAIRNIFIDHQNDVAMINQQLAKIEALARKQGYAIAIGHPREKTLQAITPWLKEMEEKGFQLVPVSTLLQQTDAGGGN